MGAPAGRGAAPLTTAPGGAGRARHRAAWRPAAWHRAARRPGPRRAALAAGLVLAAAGLFALYWRQARTQPVSSDAASIALQAASMLHGNLLLHGWAMTDVSFYSTELVQYMLLQLVVPMGPGLIYVAGAMTYTILVLLAGYLAKGRARGREAVLRACTGAGIMLAPAIGDFTGVLLHTPDHLGSAVPVLLAWLVADRCAPRWYVPAAVCLLLAWGQVADPLVEVTGAAAIALACAARSARRAARRRGGERRGDGDPGGAPRWFEPALAGAAIISAGIARLAEAAIRLLGGYVLQPVATRFAGLAALGPHAILAGKGLLGLFGAVFWTEHPQVIPPFQVFSSCLHLIGAAMAAAALVLALRRFFGRDDLMTAGLATAIALNVAIFIASTYPSDLLSIRETSEVLPFAAVLAGRLLPGALARLRLVPVLALAGAGYLAVLCVNAAAPAAPPSYANMAAWLAAHHFTRGLAAGYWQSNIFTLDSGGAVTVRDVWLDRGEFRRPGGWTQGGWGFSASWYDPARHRADFLLTVAGPGSAEYRAQLAAAERAFGSPERTYHADGFTVFTWRANLLARLARPPAS
jgi:hypothetical protein